ncbi:MAG: phosphoglucomutase/phosphomannomutase family protein [Clostridia bacterium]|nr:phosphoglucomutase/phosphomannomutase family protein [Clostridia bacterium]
MIKFGTGGWRAETGKDFNYDNIRLFAQGFCNYAKQKGLDTKPVIIGFDRRFLSDNAAKWLCEVLSANGINVITLHRSAPTPFVMHYVKKKGLYFGMEVTASHNPSNYNGIKIIIEEGRDASLEVTSELEDRINALSASDVKSTDFEDGLKNGSISYLENPFNDFIDDILALSDVSAIRDRGLRILFDPMHGSATYPLMVVLHTARCTVDIINSTKDAYFGGSMPAPTQKTLLDLSQKVVAGGYDLGIGVDGDGDRLGIIDNEGNYIDANEILCMLYWYLHEVKGWKGPVVRNLATTHMLDKIAQDVGEICYEVPVGFKYISSKLDEVDAILGGESSGGLTVRGHIYGKDSVYAATLFVEMLSKTGKTPKELLALLREKYGEYVMVEANLAFAPEAKPEILNTVMVDKKLPNFGKNIERVNYEDGCKVYFTDSSFVICRFSGTEPLLRIFAEAQDNQTASGYIQAWKEMLFN